MNHLAQRADGAGCIKVFQLAHVHFDATAVYH